MPCLSLVLGCDCLGNPSCERLGAERVGYLRVLRAEINRFFGIGLQIEKQLRYIGMRVRNQLPLPLADHAGRDQFRG